LFSFAIVDTMTNSLKLLVGNWKSNKSLTEVDEWIDQMLSSELLEQRLPFTPVVAPSLVYLSHLHARVPELQLCAQTLSSYPNGAYTGAVSAQITSQWVKYALLGHAERRRHFAESDQVVALQTIQALDNKITPIVAVDDHNWQTQLAQFEKNQLSQLLVMYEPPEAISSSGNAHAADLDQVLSAIQHITTEYKVQGVLYGGSVNSKNIQEYFAEPSISGVVPGAASLDPQEFVAMLQVALSALS